MSTTRSTRQTDDIQHRIEHAQIHAIITKTTISYRRRERPPYGSAHQLVVFFETKA